jgi:hypothetical protein
MSFVRIFNEARVDNMNIKKIKTAWIACVLIGSVCLAMAQSPETKITETNNNGWFKRVKETFINGKMVARGVEGGRGSNVVDIITLKLLEDGVITFYSTFDTKTHYTVRSYYLNGKLAAQEGDEDGDGFYETMILFNSSKEPAAAFHKKRDGSVTPFSAQELDKLKAGFSLTSDVLPQAELHKSTNAPIELNAATNAPLMP